MALAYKDRKYGFINKKGKVEIDYKYSSASNFDEAISIATTRPLSLVLIDYSMPNDCPPAGTPCDDGNPDTLSDEEDGNCLRAEVKGVGRYIT